MIITNYGGKPPYTPTPLPDFASHRDKAPVKPSLLGFAPLFLKVDKSG